MINFLIQMIIWKILKNKIIIRYWKVIYYGDFTIFTYSNLRKEYN